MAVPKKRTSRSRRDMRRAHDFLSSRLTISCPNCGNACLPHHVCLSCGYYKGRQVLKTKENQAAA
jgi:large subunit ribosomal protein L32